MMKSQEALSLHCHLPDTKAPTSTGAAVAYHDGTSDGTLLIFPTKWTCGPQDVTVHYPFTRQCHLIYRQMKRSGLFNMSSVPLTDSAR